jgi:hypothetical protein
LETMVCGKREVREGNEGVGDRVGRERNRRLCYSSPSPSQVPIPSCDSESEKDRTPAAEVSLGNFTARRRRTKRVSIIARSGLVVNRAQ